MPRKRSSGLLKISLWLFGVVFALLPIGVTYVNGRLVGRAPGWIELLAGGELFLIAGAVAADAVFKALRGGSHFRGLRILSEAWCLLVAVATSLYFGRIADAHYLDEKRRALLEAAVRAKDLALAKNYIASSGLDHHAIAEHSVAIHLCRDRGTQRYNRGGRLNMPVEIIIGAVGALGAIVTVLAKIYLKHSDKPEEVMVTVQRGSDKIEKRALMKSDEVSKILEMVGDSPGTRIAAK